MHNSNKKKMSVAATTLPSGEDKEYQANQKKIRKTKKHAHTQFV